MREEPGSLCIEKEEIQSVVERVRLLERVPRLEPYQARCLVDCLEQPEQGELWRTVFKRCLKETNFFGGFDDDTLALMENGDDGVLLRLNAKFGAESILGAGTYSPKEDEIKVKELKPRPTDYITSLACYGSLPSSVESFYHEVIHRLQIDPLKKGDVNRLMQERGIGDLMESHAWRTVAARRLPIDIAIEFVSRGRDVDRVIDAFMIVDRAKAVGVSDRELSLALHDHFVWEEIRSSRRRDWILNPDDRRYSSVRKIAKDNKWPDVWAEEYVLSRETGGCYLGLFKWLIDKCVSQGISPNDLENRLTWLKYYDRIDDLRASGIAYEELMKAVRKKSGEQQDKIPPSLHFAIDRSNLTEPSLPLNYLEAIKEGEKTVEGKGLGVMSEIARYFDGAEVCEPYLSLAIRIMMGAELLEEDKTQSSSRLILLGLASLIKRKDWNSSVSYAVALAKNPLVIPEGERQVIFGKIFSFLEEYYCLAVLKSYSKGNTNNDSPYNVSSGIAVAYSALGEKERATFWDIISFNWIEEMKHNFIFINSSIDRSNLLKMRENVYRRIKERTGRTRG